KKLRIADRRRELRLDIKRGSIVDQVMSGLSGGYSIIDQMLDDSRNPDLSKKKRARLKKLAQRYEKDLRKFYQQLSKKQEEIAKAEANVDWLSGIRDSVAAELSKFDSSD